MTRAFISYSHADDGLLDELHKHLAQLRREGSIEDWFDRKITPGDRLDDAISEELERAQLFLACASPDWIASHYAYEREFNRALELEAAGKLTIIPVIFRPCDWLNTPLSTFRALPKDGKAITQFNNQDVAFLDVVQSLRTASQSTRMNEYKSYEAPSSNEITNSSKYRIKREFDQLDKHDFVNEAFEKIYYFFQNSGTELNSIENLECRVSRLVDDSFTCTVVNRGLKRGFETIHIRKGSSWSPIDVLYGESNNRSTSNGGFTVHSDGYDLFLVPSLFGGLSGEREKKMSPDDCAKYIWDTLLSKVGIEYG